MPFTIQKVLLDVSSSDVTGGPYWIGDFTQLSLSRVTQTGTASNLTVQMNNQDGFQAALTAAGYSNVTAISAQGMFGIETGSRWIRVLRASASSETIILNGLVNR